MLTIAGIHPGLVSAVRVCVCVCVCLCLQRREPHSSSDEPQGSQLLIGSCLGDPPKPLSPELYYLKRESI